MTAPFRTCLHTLWAIGGRRLGLALVLSAALALAEGSGLLLLVPLLGAVGAAQQGRLPAGWEWAASLPLEGLLIGWTAIVIAHAALGAWRDGLSARLVEQVIAERRSALHSAAAAMDWRSFQADRAADLTAMLAVTAVRLGHGASLLINAAGRIAQMTAHLVVALWLAPLAAGLALATGGGLALLRLKGLRRAFVGGRTQVMSARVMQAMIAEHVGSMKLAKSFGAEQRHAAAFARRAERVGQARAASLTTQAHERAIFRGGGALAMALTVWAMVDGLGVSGVALLVLVAVFARLLPAAGDLMHLASQATELMAAWTEAEAMLARCRAAAEPPPPADLHLPGGDIVLDRVCFRWPGRADTLALDGVSLTIPERSVTAVVGPSGAGKSTLADLLLGLLAPESGGIGVGGTTLNGPARAAWRQRTGYVPQEVFLFHDSVRANLLWARPEADDAALWRVLEQAAVAEVVRGLPNGLDTVLGDRGAWLSGGERQRLAIARALLREPALLVLDEATSHLDREAERAVQEALQTLHGQVTIVVIAHRLVTVKDADRVVVLQDGRVSAQGTWSELTAGDSGWLARVVEDGVAA